MASTTDVVKRMMLMPKKAARRKVSRVDNMKAPVWEQ